MAGLYNLYIPLKRFIAHKYSELGVLRLRSGRKALLDLVSGLLGGLAGDFGGGFGRVFNGVFSLLQACGHSLAHSSTCGAWRTTMHAYRLIFFTASETTFKYLSHHLIRSCLSKIYRWWDSRTFNIPHSFGALTRRHA